MSPLFAPPLRVSRRKLRSAARAADSPYLRKSRRQNDTTSCAGFDVVDKPLLNWYVSEEKKRNGHEIGEVKWKQVKKNHDDTLGQGEDVVYVIGRVGGEGNDVGAGIEDTFEENGDYLHLNEAELSVLEGLKGMKDDGAIRSITVIVNSANPVSMAFADEEDYGVDAMLWVGSVGQTGLYAVGDVLSGAVTLELGGKSYRVRKGDSFSFKPSQQHHLKNTGKTPATVIWVCTPPNF